MRASLFTFFAWAIREGLTETNPVAGTGRREETSRDRVLTDAEIAAIWNALGNNDYDAILRLLLLTAQRANEIAGLRWSEVHEDEIALPAERVKNARIHRVPITAPVREILDAQPRRLGRDLIFGRGEREFSGWSKSTVQLDERIREMTGSALPHWTPHDLRRSAATRMADLGIAPHIVETVLNHVSGHKAGVSGIYNRATYSTEKRQALDQWAEHVLAGVKGCGNKIVPLVPRGA